MAAPMPGKPPSLETPIGFGSLVGYRLAVWGPDHAEPELHPEPRHLNRSQVTSLFTAART
jgi:hypothetical protein